MVRELSNKEFAFRCMKLLSDKNIPLNIIICLTDHEFCKINFNCKKPILKLVNSQYNIPQEIINDYTNQPRFDKDTFNYNGNFFLITNYWYGPNTNHPDNKTPFYNWVLSIIS